jgi:hypothetical protein
MKQYLAGGDGGAKQGRDDHQPIVPRLGTMAQGQNGSDGQRRNRHPL